MFFHSLLYNYYVNERFVMGCIDIFFSFFPQFIYFAPGVYVCVCMCVCVCVCVCVCTWFIWFTWCCLEVYASQSWWSTAASQPGIPTH